MFMDGSVLNRSSLALEWRLSARNSRVLVASQNGVYDTGQNRLVFQSDAGGVFQYGGRAYRGYAYVIAQGSSLTLVNTVPVEEYVQGVLPSEMPSSWPLEALKAQAIIARTYAMSRLNQSGDYDVCATERCQVYNGATAETYAGNAAVAATDGLIVAWGDKPAQTFFSADSGGFTASSKEVWGSDLPYLVARPDPDSLWAGSDFQLRPNAGTISSTLARFAPRVGAYRGMSVTARSESGRVWEVSVTGSNGSARIVGRDAQTFMRALGAKSTIANVVSSNPLVISGSGNGHGVGLSQWGARGLAARGWTFDQILGYYYTGVSLSGYVVADQAKPSSSDALMKAGTSTFGLQSKMRLDAPKAGF